jgi:antigen flippase
LQAMGTDFYPRLTTVAKDNESCRRLLNEQIEMGILMALPGLLAAVALAPLLLFVFYSREFLEGAVLLPWLLLGVLGQLIGWPLAMLQTAKSATRYIYLTRTHGAVLLLCLTLVLIPTQGLVGAAYAFALYAWIQNGLLYVLSCKLCSFAFSWRVKALCGCGSLLIVVNMALVALLPSIIGEALALAIAFVTLGFCVYMIAAHAAPNNRYSQIIISAVKRIHSLVSCRV